MPYFDEMCFDLRVLSLRLHRDGADLMKKSFYVRVSIFSIDFTGLVASKHLCLSSQFNFVSRDQS